MWLTFTGKKIGEFSLYIPVGERLTIVHSEHQNINSTIAELIKDYYIELGESVLYFPAERYFTLSKDEIEAIKLAEKLTDNNATDIFFEFLDLQVNSWDYEDLKGKKITSGYQHLIHFAYKIHSAPKPSIVIIDNFEENLHVNLRIPFLFKVKYLSLVKQIIVTTRDETLQKMPGYHEYNDFMRRGCIC